MVSYARRMEDAGVKVTWKNYAEEHHGMTNDNGDYGTFKLSRMDHVGKTIENLTDFVRKSL